MSNFARQPHYCKTDVTCRISFTMYISKKDREIVKNKFGDKCAYTGTELTLLDYLKRF